MSKKSINNSKKYNENDKVSLAPNLEVERKQNKKQGSNESNFIPNLNSWTALEEQKVKTKELEN